ncbi:MAG: urease accessory protein UreF [Dyadobacter sp.]|uniref:urease accessory protein UreF n=1 Tax=Dyadobacter sp. TaxID=1914288 RepID=UPI001B2F548B|nr:urease accessory protein UreF [Dyadobacter sp.]MBO9616935.1 urease accessory protein UreF [Dyadobacter sp.]
MQKESPNSFLAALLHLSDPTLPIGGYVHSNGLETYVQQDIVHSTATAKEFVTNMLMYNVKYNDASFVRLAYEAVADIDALVELDQECSALKSPREIREASQKLGVRLLKIFQRKRSSALADAFDRQIKEKNAEGHYCLAFGLLARQLGIPLHDTLLAFYYNAAAGLITNAVKLVPLGQLDGQDLMLDLQPVLYQLAEDTLLVNRELVGLCNIAFDIRCMQHERLYSRLYMS